MDIRNFHHSRPHTLKLLHLRAPSQPALISSKPVLPHTGPFTPGPLRNLPLASFLVVFASLIELAKHFQDLLTNTLDQWLSK